MNFWLIFIGKDFILLGVGIFEEVGFCIKGIFFWFIVLELLKFFFICWFLLWSVLIFVFLIFLFCWEVVFIVLWDVVFEVKDDLIFVVLILWDKFVVFVKLMEKGWIN